MRTLTASTTTEIEKTGTTPRFLVELGTTPITRHSTRETLTYDGQTWTGFDIHVDSIDIDKNGGQSASLRVSRHNNAMAALLFDGSAEMTCRIWMLYGDGPTWAPADGNQLFDGVVDGLEINGNYIAITAIDLMSKTEFAPRITLAPPLANHLPPAGKKIRIGPVVYVLEPRNG